MKLSLSARVGEQFFNKRVAALTLSELADIAVTSGYHAVCMRASQVGVHSSREQIAEAAALLKRRGLAVSMITGDFAIPENSDEGPAALRAITPFLDLAEAFECNLIRVALRVEEDIEWARRASLEARERNIRLVHQCHNRSLFTYEPANLELCGESYGADTIARLAPHIFNVYLQNQRLDPAGPSVINTWCRGPIRFEQIPLWDTRGINFPAVLAQLAAMGYQGHVTVHQAGLNTPAIDGSESARYLRSIHGFAPVMGQPV
jgi:sugar phosphate isomerase/epimerase